MNLNKSLADELNQPTTFRTAYSIKNSENKAQNPLGLDFLTVLKVDLINSGLHRSLNITGRQK